jgi:cytochrome c-type biogenesis protein CcmH
VLSAITSVRRGFLILVVLCASIGAPAQAVSPDEVLANPELEARARAISQLLRCVVCQNQSIDDSAAPLARDLRILVRQRLIDGDSDREALAYIVARYGNFVLLQPPLQINTALLWFGPGLLMIVSCLGIGLHFWGRRETKVRPEEMPGTSIDDRERMEKLLTKGLQA